MDFDEFVKLDSVMKMNKAIILEIALLVNKKLFEENNISYKMLKYTEENILRQKFKI